MNDNRFGHTLLMSVVLALGALWALAMSTLIIVTCSVAHILAVLTFCALTPFRRRAECPDILGGVAIPRIADMWRDLADMQARERVAA